MRKLFPTLLSLGKPETKALSNEEHVAVPTAEQTQVQLTTALQISKLLEKAFNTDISLLRDPYLAKNVKF